MFFSLMLTEEYVLVIRNFLTLHKFKREDDLTNASYLLVVPNQMILTILIDQI